MVAAAKCGRNSIGIEISPDYAHKAYARLEKSVGTLISSAQVRYLPMQAAA
jgi:DNA modification methylase